jgi:putative nucleotidyltransferase with HDIG domain
MEPFSFKKIKFFSGEESRSKKPKTSRTGNHNKTKSGFLQQFFEQPYFFLVIFALAIASLVSYVPSKSLPIWEQGEIAPADLVAPAELTIVDEETTENRKIEAENNVNPVYRLNSGVFVNTRSKLREFFEAGRNLIVEPPENEERQAFLQSINDRFYLELTPQILRDLIKLEFSTALEESLITLIGRVSERGIILNKNLYTHNEQETGFTVVRSQGVETTEFVYTLPDKEEAKNRLTDEINRLELPPTEKVILTALSHAFLAANVEYDAIETAARKAAASRMVDPIYYTIKRGKVIIRKGDEVSEDALEDIRIINQNLSAQPNWLINFAGSFILIMLFLSGVLYYLKTGREPDRALNRFIMTCVILLLSLLLYKFSGYMADLISQNTRLAFFSDTDIYRYAYPVQMGAVLITFLGGVHLALFFTIINSILFGYLFNSAFLTIFVLVGGFAAILGVRILGNPTRTPVLRAGILLIAPVNVAAITAFHLMQGGIGPVRPYLGELFMGILGGVLGSALAFVLVPLFENLFGIVTHAKLLELTNSDLPIFRKMAMAAPGSYHHSLVVSSLAEAAAEEIGLDPMLVKAGALYHDIGKIKRPEYFIENRTRNFDMHKDLKPSMSVLVIVNHVKEGVEQANKLRLPKKVKDIIAQHHGNSLVRYFFEKAKVEYDPDMHKIGEESYRYPGPRPRTREAAIVMLADAVEAASRSLKSPTKSNLKRLITEIINASMDDGQLDECPFSLKELKQVANTFLTTLDTIYHPRVEYPGFDFEKRKNKASKMPKSNDRNSQPAKTI